MKTTNHFTRTILTYLEQRAEIDSLFAEAFANANKDIDSCINYILNVVQKSGCNGFADEEIYSIAEEYYLTENIEVGKAINCKAVINHVIELTQEEKEQARQEAIQKAQDEAYNRVLKSKKKSDSKQTTSTNQLTLF